MSRVTKAYGRAWGKGLRSLWSGIKCVTVSLFGLSLLILASPAVLYRVIFPKGEETPCTD